MLKAATDAAIYEGVNYRSEKLNVKPESIVFWRANVKPIDGPGSLVLSRIRVRG